LFLGNDPAVFFCHLILQRGRRQPRVHALGFLFLQEFYLMLTAHGLCKSYNIDTILKEVTFSINPGERVGLIGPNGCGKTTLLRILAGEEKPDQGRVSLTPGSIKLGYLPQGFKADPDQSLGAVVQDALGTPNVIAAEVALLGGKLSENPDRRDLQVAYDAALQKLEALDPADYGRAASILEALGLSDVPDDLPVGKLSGGQKTRLSLALVLLKKPHILLLDEPTNHLDIEMLEWLEYWLLEFPGAALIVSHDRTFLDHTVSRILDFDPEKHHLTEYNGNYSDYVRQYRAAHEKQLEAYQDQVYEIRRMKQDIARTKQQAHWVEQTTTSRQPGVRRIAKKVAKKAKSREKKLERFLDSDDRLERPKAGWQMKLAFDSSPAQKTPKRLGQDVLFLKDLSIGYPGQPALLKDITLQARAGRRIILTGPNGAGKTTLLRTIAGMIRPISGNVRLGASVRLGFMTQEQELLEPTQNAVEAIQVHGSMNETEIRSFLHFFLFSGDEALRPIEKLSYGERARLALAVLVAQGSNFLLLDEPINHLDIPSRERFEQALKMFEGTILAVVHDRYFIERFATDLWLVEDLGIQTKVIIP
jgi:ATP-binding cassette, subfamily F, member 3